MEALRKCSNCGIDKDNVEFPNKKAVLCRVCTKKLSPESKETKKSSPESKETKLSSKDELRVNLDTLLKGRGTKAEIFHFLKLFSEYYSST